jgi:hypothetical protein
MDDGFYHQGGVGFSTYCFSYSDHLKMKDTFEKVYQLHPKIWKRPSGFV